MLHGQLSRMATEVKRWLPFIEQEATVESDLKREEWLRLAFGGRLVGSGATIGVQLIPA